VNKPGRAFLLLAPLLMAATACRKSEAPAPHADWELRSYEVPAADRQAVVGVLRGLLNEGKIELSPDGRIAMLAPPRIHQQVQREILQPLAARARPGAAPAKPSNFSITYWMVRARPGPGGPAASATPPGLEEVAAVLPEIRKTGNASELELLERLLVRSMEGSATTAGRAFIVRQKASLFGGNVISDLVIQALVHPVDDGGILMPKSMTHEEILTSRVSLKPGQTTVVGQLGLRGVPAGQGKAGRPPERDDTLFIILQASLDDALAAK
jgi:hypothetical protein